jgi:hypothetical protein
MGTSEEVQVTELGVSPDQRLVLRGIEYPRILGPNWHWVLISWTATVLPSLTKVERMDSDQSRRRFLELAGTGTVISLAGCNSLGGRSPQPTDALTRTDDTAGAEESSDEATDLTEGEETAVGIGISGDQEKLQQAQQEIQAQMQNGNLSRAEAAQEYQTIQQELRAEAFATFEDRVQTEAGLTISESVEELGLLLVSGTPANLLGTLGFDEVQAIVSETRFRQTKAQADQQTESG